MLLAHAQAFMAGLPEAHAGIAETFELLEQRFWEPDHGLYADEIGPDGVLSGYRGQNANMHMCEALLAAFDATGEIRYLVRAERLADHICIRQAALADGLVWEHYRADWSVDWDYNKDDKSNIFRPWGFQPGHQIADQLQPRCRQPRVLVEQPDPQRRPQAGQGIRSFGPFPARQRLSRTRRGFLGALTRAHHHGPVAGSGQDS